MNELTSGALKLRQVQQEKTDHIEVATEFLDLFTDPYGIGGHTKAVFALKAGQKPRKEKNEARKKFNLTKNLV